MKKRIKLVLFFLITSVVIFLLVVTYVVINTIQLEKTKFEYSSRYIISSSFHNTHIPFESIDSLSAKIDIPFDEIDSFSNWFVNQHPNDSTIYYPDTKAKRVIKDSLKKVFYDYINFAPNAKALFKKNKINVPFDYLLCINNFYVYKNGKKYILAEELKDSSSTIYLSGNKSLRKGDSPPIGFYYRTKSYTFQVNLFYQFDNMFAYFWRKIDSVVLSLGAILILFCFIVWFTMKTIKRQDELSEMKNDFINNITHELKTPITTLNIASTTLAQPQVNTDNKLVANLNQTIANQTKRLSELIDKVLNISVLKGNNINLNLQKKEPDVLLASIVHDFKISNGSASIEENMDANGVFCLLDPFYFEMVITNLLDNAVKYSGPSPEITVSSKVKNKQLLISISDKGSGIHKKEIKYIFDKFYRVSTGNIHKVKGTGLGLYYVKLIVEAHKGNISVSSEKDKGSTFVVCFNCS